MSENLDFSLKLESVILGKKNMMQETVSVRPDLINNWMSGTKNLIESAKFCLSLEILALTSMS